MREEPTVAYLGPSTSYSHQAAEKCFPGSEFFLVPKRSIQAVVDAVQAGEVDRGVIPFENSSQGPVFPTLDTLSHSHLSCSDLSIAGETSLNISHCLLVRPSKENQLTPPESPGDECPPPTTTYPEEGLAFDDPVFSDLRRIRHVYSHPQALGQCKDFLARMLPQAEIHSTNSTAEAAQRIAKDASDTSAAIGSARTARELGLQVLLEGMQDVRENMTRFIVLKRDGLSASGPQFRRASLAMLDLIPKDQFKVRTETRKLLVSFAIDARSQQGKLVRALGTFDKPSIQVTGIHSRPSRKSPFHYVYFVEASFVSTSGTDADSQIKETLRDLGKVAQSRRCHGSWGPTMEW